MAEKKKTPLRSTPRRKQAEDLERFAAAAGKNNRQAVGAYPWEEEGVREDVVKNLPLRLSEPLYLKLKFIAAHTPYSMNSFILERLTEEVEREIERLTEGV